MSAQRLTGATFLFLALTLAPRGASAQTFPVVPGALEVQVGAAAVILPENTNGTYAVQPLTRVGFFLVEGIELSIEASARVWPLGQVAPASYGIGANASWYPNLGPQNRNIYLLGGAGVLSRDPPGNQGDSTWDPFLRGAVGFKVPLEGIGLGFLNSMHLSVEFREELLLEDETDLVTGAALGFSYFL